MKRLLLALILLPQIALAATNETQYVRSGCANNGDGTTSACAASGGAAGAFNTFSAWESQNRNLVSQDKNLTVKFLGSTADNTRVTISGWTTDATRAIRLTCDEGACHTGVWSDSIYRLDYNGEVDNHAVEINDPNVTFDRMQIKRTISGNYIGAVIYSDTDSANTKLLNCIFWKTSSASTSGSYNAAVAHWVDGWVIANNVIINDEVSSAALYLRPSGTVGWVSVAYNNTIIGGSKGLVIASYDADAGYLMVKNNLISGSASGDYEPESTNSLTTLTNATSDATSPQTGLRTRTFTFVNAAGDNFHLAAGDTGAQAQGTDLSGDSYYALSTDIDGNTRSGTWDIGADEVVSASGMNLLLLHAEGY